MRSAPVLLLLLASCGSSIVDETDTSSSSAGGGSATTTGVTATIGSGNGATTADATATSTTSSSSGDGGGAAVTATVGSTTTGSGGSGGEPPAAACDELPYCDCVTNAACAVVAEDCFCPCGIEPCEPDCACDCGGGLYLGCSPTSIINPGELEHGVWLIGWGGGLNHYSWVRFEANGALTVLDGAGMNANAPYYPCNGGGTWVFGAEPEVVHLQLPPECPASRLRFGPWMGDPSWPEGATQAVNITDTFQEDFPLTGYRFGDAQCDEAMTDCGDPLSG